MRASGRKARRMEEESTRRQMAPSMRVSGRTTKGTEGESPDLLRCKLLQDDLKGLLERANAKAVELGGDEDDVANVAIMSNNDMKQNRMKNGQCIHCGLQTHEVKTIPNIGVSQMDLVFYNVTLGKKYFSHILISFIFNNIVIATIELNHFDWNIMRYCHFQLQRTRST